MGFSGGILRMDSPDGFSGWILRVDVVKDRSAV